MTYQDETTQSDASLVASALQLQAHAATVADYINAADALDLKKEKAHAAALAIKTALWKKGEDGKLSGKKGRHYSADVLDVLEAAYPMPANPTDKQRNAVKVARSKLYQVIDTTTKGRLGTRKDRSDEAKAKRAPSHKRKMGAGFGAGVKLEGPDAKDAYSALDAAWRAADVEYVQFATLLAELAPHVNGRALDAFAALKDLVAERPAFVALGQMVCDVSIDAQGDVAE